MIIENSTKSFRRSLSQIEMLTILTKRSSMIVLQKESVGIIFTCHLSLPLTYPRLLAAVPIWVDTNSRQSLRLIL